MVRLDNITLSFADKSIFENFSTDIKRGENVCFSGASGRGKSSLLKVIQGYITPQKGNITINDIELSSSSINKIRESIIWIPQNINLPVNNAIELMSIMDISFNKKHINTYLEELGLDANILSKDFTKISGGQKQRIIIAICLSLNKEIILMDEPTSSLDEDSISLLINTLKNMSGKTIISASHNLTWLNSVDKVIKL